ncbi:hypothetical protein ABZX93_34415 [Streptomyces sp. NPDC006632]|uniref:hypothetical protein n=1 Tax=unclassified Streptomyces TaxID=2593676 RepID=UPI002E1AA0A7
MFNEWIIAGLFPVWLIGLIAAIYAVAASFFVSEEKKTGCLWISVSFLAVLLYPVLMVWVSLS